MESEVGSKEILFEKVLARRVSEKDFSIQPLLSVNIIQSKS